MKLYLGATARPGSLFPIYDFQYLRIQTATGKRKAWKNTVSSTYSLPFGVWESFEKPHLIMLYTGGEMLTHHGVEIALGLLKSAFGLVIDLVIPGNNRYEEALT